MLNLVEFTLYQYLYLIVGVLYAGWIFWSQRNKAVRYVLRGHDTGSYINLGTWLILLVLLWPFYILAGGYR